MHSRPLRQTAAFAQRLAGKHSDLIQFKEAVNGLGIALLRKVQESSPLIQFFFLGMRGCTPFHSTAFLHPPATKMVVSVCNEY